MPRWQHLFGPVASRRFGRSLGVDLMPSGRKRCTLDCVFCQLGPTPTTTAERSADVPIGDVLSELDAWRQSGSTADFVTLSGNGEPTLHPDFAQVFAWVRAHRPLRSLLLSNGSLFTLPEVRRDAAHADVVKLSLHAWDADSYARLVRPHPSVEFEAVIDAYRQFRGEYTGELVMEVFIVPGLNDEPVQIDRMATLLAGMRPERIHLNTTARPPADASVRAVSPTDLLVMARRFKPVAETPEAPPPLSPTFNGKPARGDDETAEAIIALVCRHPADLNTLALESGYSETRTLALLLRLHREERISLTQTDGVWVAGPPPPPLIGLEPPG